MEQYIDQKLGIHQNGVPVVPLDRQNVISIFFRRTFRLLFQCSDSAAHRVIFLGLGWLLFSDDWVVGEIVVDWDFTFFKLFCLVVKAFLVRVVIIITLFLTFFLLFFLFAYS